MIDLSSAATHHDGERLLAEIYLGAMIGGGIEYWFAYVLALVVLLVRPQGLFGEKLIERI